MDVAKDGAIVKGGLVAAEWCQSVSGSAAGVSLGGSCAGSTRGAKKLDSFTDLITGPQPGAGGANIGWFPFCFHAHTHSPPDSIWVWT